MNKSDETISYIESLKVQFYESCDWADKPTDVIVKKSNDEAYGIYAAYDNDDYRLECTDETINIYFAVSESPFADEYRERIWALLIEEAMTHGLKEELPNLSKFSDDDLIAELKRRGMMAN